MIFFFLPSSLEDAAEVAGENRQVRFPDLHSTRGKVSRDLISVSSETSEQTDKFLHCGAEEAGGGKPHARGGWGVKVLIRLGVVASNTELRRQEEGTAHSTLQLLCQWTGLPTYSKEPD